MSIHVEKLDHIDTTRYKEGDIFMTDKKVAVLQNGEIQELVKKEDLKLYVRKSEVKKMIADELKGSDK